MQEVDEEMRESSPYEGPLGYFGCLPNEMMAHVFSFLSVHAKVQCMASCKTFYSLKQRLFYPLAPSLTVAHHRFLQVKDLAKVADIYRHKSPSRCKARCSIPLQGRRLEQSFLSPQGELCLLVFQYGCSLYNLAKHDKPIYAKDLRPRLVYFSPDGRTIALLRDHVYSLTILWLSPHRRSVIETRVAVPMTHGAMIPAPFLNTAFLSSGVANMLLIPCQHSLLRADLYSKTQDLRWVCFTRLKEHSVADHFFLSDDNKTGGSALGWIESGNTLCHYQGDKVRKSKKTNLTLTPLQVERGLLYLKEQQLQQQQLQQGMDGVVKVLIVDLETQDTLFSTTVPAFQVWGPLGHTLSLERGLHVVGRDIFNGQQWSLSRQLTPVRTLTANRFGYLSINGMSVQYFHWWFDKPVKRRPRQMASFYYHPPAPTLSTSTMYWW